MKGHRWAENWAETRAVWQPIWGPPVISCLLPLPHPTGITQSIFDIGFCSKVEWSYVLALLPARNRVRLNNLPKVHLRTRKLREAQAVRMGLGSRPSPLIQAELRQPQDRVPTPWRAWKG